MGNRDCVTLYIRVRHQYRDCISPKRAGKHGKLMDFYGGHLKSQTTATSHVYGGEILSFISKPALK